MSKYILALLLLMHTAMSAQEFKNIQAKNALEKYKAELKKAEDIKDAAEVKLKKELTEALASTMKTGDLDEANKIKAVLDGKELGKDETKVEPVKVEKEKPPALVIISATYGAGSETIDVTSRIKGLVQNDSLEMTVDGFSDVAQNKVKYLIINYTLNRVKGVAKSATGGEIRINVKDKK